MQQTQNKSPILILPHLYIGNQFNAADKNTLQILHITHICNLSSCNNFFDGNPDCNFQYYQPDPKIVDTADYKLSTLLYGIFDFLDNTLEVENIVNIIFILFFKRLKML